MARRTARRPSWRRISGNKYRVLEHDVDPELTLCWLENVPGALHACLESIASANLDNGRIIRDMLIGVPEDGRIPVQIYSEEVRTGRRSKS